MSRLKELIQKAPVHERRLEFKTYPLEDDRVIVEGWLRDERLTTGYHWDARIREPGVVHHLCVRLLVGGTPLSIQDAEAEMPVVPHPLCPTTQDALEKITGLPIVTGFSDRVRELIGGIEGCSHIMHLVIAMGPAALHGYWTQQSTKPPAAPRSADRDPRLDYVINSCRLWREDGPLIQRVRAASKESSSVRRGVPG